MPRPTPRPFRPRLSRKHSYHFFLLAAAVLTGAAGAPGIRYFQAYGDRPGDVLDRAALDAETPFLRSAAIPFVLPAHFGMPSPPPLTATFPFRLDPTASDADRQCLRRIAEGLKRSATGKRLYAYVQHQFADKGRSDREIRLQLANLGESGNRAMTTGTPPAYRITLNRQLIGRFGWEALVPKLAHEIVHIRDYERPVTRCVAMEVSAHAADAAVAYEASVTTSRRPDGPFTRLTSLQAVYDRCYVPFRQHPSAAGYQHYWQALMNLVTYTRAYRQVYVDDHQETVWNAPAGPPTATSYVPYDPAYAVLE